MSFSEFCASLATDADDGITTGKSIQFRNSTGKQFSVSIDGIQRFVRYYSQNFQQLEESWKTREERKDSLVKYEEKSYRAIYVSGKDKDGLEEIAALGGSQTKPLTAVITKLICYITDKDYAGIVNNTRFTESDFKLASSILASDPEIKGHAQTAQPSSDTRKEIIRENFRKWLLARGKSEKTAKEYTKSVITKADQIYKELDSSFESALLLSSDTEVSEFVSKLSENEQWASLKSSGHSMYSAGINWLVKFLQQYNPVELVTISKPFILLAGISGTGKTRFIREQADATGTVNETYQLVPVRPDWHEPSDLLGYVSRLSGKATYVPTDVLRFMVSAWKETTAGFEKDNSGALQWLPQKPGLARPFWLCLDEMNLAPVEQYFADYLSILETRNWEWHSEDSFSYTCDPILPASTIQLLESDAQEKLANDLGLTDAGGNQQLWNYFCENGISIPYNLIVAGTVNMDETTHGFSRKVIDRALSIDFGEFFPNNYDEYFKQSIYPNALSYPVHSAGSDILEEHFSGGSADPDGMRSKDFLNKVKALLESTPFALAYRALNELLLGLLCNTPDSDEALKAVWDDFIMCKVLPRIEGDTDKLSAVSEGASEEVRSVIDSLYQLLEQEFESIWDRQNRPDLFNAYSSGEAVLIECRSRKKLQWMNRRLKTSAFTSFWP